MDIHKPVSYTHLDVYKRQVTLSAVMAAPTKSSLPGQSIIFSFFPFHSTSVSYTHLDVYKRQFKDKPSMTRLIDNMERQHLVVRIADKRDRRTNLIHLTRCV